ncbi:MAG: TetR/AcrR family transcriptional regulator [Alphaproteobacteria bacterium]|nr:MAG: TetR/AcrR family transcriptional regulator [Alphaproteobacteria bacterium]
MSEHRSRPHRKRGYHHGDLAEAMTDVALKLIAEFGPAGFTLAEVARVIGVSAAAPYRHFKDREALIAHIASRGFEKFTAALNAAWNEGAPDPGTAFMNVGRAYLKFAEREPAYYAAMFEARLPTQLQQEVTDASTDAFAVLRQAVETLIADMPKPKRPPAMMVALHIWSLSHGIADLFGRNNPNAHPIPMEPEDLLEAGVLIYLEGLGIPLSPAKNG